VRASSFARSRNSVSCTVTGHALPQPFELFFELSGAEPSHNGNWALAALLVPATAWGEGELEIDAPVSAKLLSNLATIQEIYEHGVVSAPPVAIRVAGAIRDAAPSQPNSASFFSGGVDSLHTLIENRETLTHLILANGFDILLRQDKFFSTVESLARKAASAFSKRLLIVRTNVRDLYGKTGVEWIAYHGSVLAAIALCLDEFASSVLIASTYSYEDLHPWSSHPLLDPLWSTETLRVVHDGAGATRMKKVEVVAREPAALSIVRVCWEELDPGLNCGRCEKCMRTMLALELLGRLEQCPTLPHRIDERAIGKFALSEDAMLYWREFLGYPMDSRLRRTIESAIRTQEMGFGTDYGTWKSKARRALVLARHMRDDLAAGLRMLGA